MQPHRIVLFDWFNDLAAHQVLIVPSSGEPQKPCSEIVHKNRLLLPYLQYLHRIALAGLAWTLYVLEIVIGPFYGLWTSAPALQQW